MTSLETKPLNPSISSSAATIQETLLNRDPLEGLSVGSLRSGIVVNPSLQETIQIVLGSTLERIQRGSSTTLNSVTEISKVCSNWILNNLGERDKQVAVKTKDAAGDVGPDTVSLAFSAATPVAAGMSILAIRHAAKLAHEEPERIAEARAKLLIGLADVSLFLGSFAWWTSPVAAVAGSVLLAVKVLNWADKILTKNDEVIDRDKMLKAAQSMSESIIMKPCLNVLLRSIHTLDTNLVNRVNSLKDEFAPNSSEREKALGQKMLTQFHSLYSQYYKDGEQESRDAMCSYLKDTVDSWDLHVITDRKNQVVGGFTCFTQKHPEFGTHLYVEQILPPPNIDPVGNDATWSAIRSLAATLGAKRIWLESRVNETIPSDFNPIDILHAQPALLGQFMGPVGLPGDSSTELLHMSVCNLDPTSSTPTHREYQTVIVDQCTSTWAHPEDPAWKLLMQNPRDDSPLRFKPPQ